MQTRFTLTATIRTQGDPCPADSARGAENAGPAETCV